MIAQIAGRLLAKDLDRVEVMTSGGVGYELSIPLGVYEALPRPGEDVLLHTHLVVRDDGWLLFGFASATERRVFQKLLTANGVGPALALGLLSHLSAERLVRALRERDVVTLQSVPRVGRKKAERLVLDLADKLDDLPEHVPGGVRPAPARRRRRRGDPRPGAARLHDGRCREGGARGARRRRPCDDRVGADPERVGPRRRPLTCSAHSAARRSPSR